MKTIFEKGSVGQHLTLLPVCDVPEVHLTRERTSPPRLPHVSENELTRHYKQLSDRVHGVNDGFYPLGSCTMKYNPKIDEAAAAQPGFTGIHPLQGESTVQGCWRSCTPYSGICALSPAWTQFPFSRRQVPTESSPDCC